MYMPHPCTVADRALYAGWPIYLPGLLLHCIQPYILSFCHVDPFCCGCCTRITAHSPICMVCSAYTAYGPHFNATRTLCLGAMVEASTYPYDSRSVVLLRSLDCSWGFAALHTMHNGYPAPGAAHTWRNVQLSDSHLEAIKSCAHWNILVWNECISITRVN